MASLFLAPLWLAATLAAGVAHGQAPGQDTGPGAAPENRPSPDPTDQARRAYSDGEAAYRLNHFEQAARWYEEAYRIMKLPTMLYDIAQAWRRQYELDKNIDHALRAAELYRAFVRDAPTAKQRPSAEKFIAGLDAQIAAAKQRPKGQDLFDKGRLAFDTGRYADAIQAFEASYALDRTPTTLWHIGLACVSEYRIHHDPALLRRAAAVFANFGEHSDRAEDKAKVAEQQAGIDTLLAEAAAAPPAVTGSAPAAAPAPAVDLSAKAPAAPPKKRWPLYLGIGLGGGVLLVGAVTLGVVLGTRSSLTILPSVMEP